jgi:hypothetical protein
MPNSAEKYPTFVAAIRTDEPYRNPGAAKPLADEF